MRHFRIRWSWVIVVSTGAAVFGLGLAGFSEFFHRAGQPKTLTDLLYLTGQLFTAESGAVEGTVPWNLEVARFSAPLVSAYAVLSAVFALFSLEFRRFWLRFRSGHVILCGLGRKGSRLVEELREAGNRVVVIEPDAHNPGVARCRELKAIVIHGRSDDDWNLARAHIGKAKMLIATAGDDAVNIETAVRANRLTGHRTDGHLRCVVHVTDPALQHLLKRHEIYGDQKDRYELALVNVYEVGARLMLESARLFGGSRAGREIRVCLVGLGQFGEAVLRRLLRDWPICGGRMAGGQNGSGGGAYGAAAPPPVLEVVIVDRDAAAKEESIRQRFEGYLENVRLHFVTRDVRAPGFAGPDLEISRPDQKFDAFFVCFDDDSLGTLASIRLRDRFGSGAPIVVRMTGSSGFASLLGCGPEGCRGPLEGIETIGFMEIACMRDLFLGGDDEILARAFHEAYLDGQLTHAGSAKPGPNAVPWHALSSQFRERNRSRAAGIHGVLRAAGLAAVACPDRPIALFTFSDAEVETLAEAEHTRWLAEMRAGGWREGKDKDEAQKLNPNVVGWPALPAEIREFNRITIRRLPAILAHADFEISRRPETG